MTSISFISPEHVVTLRATGPSNLVDRDQRVPLHHAITSNKPSLSLKENNANKILTNSN